jgi:hypothetical protein
MIAITNAGLIEMVWHLRTFVFLFALGSSNACLWGEISSNWHCGGKGGAENGFAHAFLVNAHSVLQR